MRRRVVTMDRLEDLKVSIRILSTNLTIIFLKIKPGPIMKPILKVRPKGEKETTFSEPYNSILLMQLKGSISILSMRRRQHVYHAMETSVSQALRQQDA